jgi:hypothetical protein
MVTLHREPCPGRSTASTTVEPITARDFAGLPTPVAAYFRRAIPLGTAPPSTMVLEQSGDILVGRRWRAFQATQELTPPPASFVWHAAIHMAPLLTTRVRDSYVRGVGAMHATVASLFTVVNASDGPSLNTGALLRYLGECVWLPTALLPRYAVMWSPLDARRARATLKDAGNQVSLEFTFNGRGEVTEVFTPVRPRSVDRRFEPTPWRVQMTRYGERGGFWIPVEAEVAWEIDGVWEPCWRGRIGQVRTTGQAAGTVVELRNADVPRAPQALLS